MQRESTRKEWLCKANQSSTLTPKKDDDGRLGLITQSKENLENVEADLKSVPPDGPTASISKPFQHVQDEHEAKTRRETQYRALYLRVKEDYEKLSKAYLKLKQSHAASKNAFKGQEMHHIDPLNKAPKDMINRDTIVMENIRYPEAPRTSSLNLLLSSFSHPTSEVSKPRSSPLAGPRKEDRSLNRGTWTNNAVEEKICKDHRRSEDPADQKIRNLVPLQELQATHEFTKFTQMLTVMKDVKEPVEEKLSLAEVLSENDSDEPIVLSERSLKRKRPGTKQNNTSNAAKEAHISNESLTKPVRIKSELESSSPYSPLAHQSLVKPNDSIDLDDVGDRTLTPRKRRRVWACLYGEDEISCTRTDDDSTSLLPQLKRSRSSMAQIGHHPSTPKSPQKSRLFCQDRICDSEATAGQTRRNVLAVMDPNRRMLPNTNDPTRNQQCATQTAPKSQESSFDINHGLPSEDKSYRIAENKWLAKGEAIFRDDEDKMAMERPKLPSLSSHFAIERKHEEMVSVTEAGEPLRDLPRNKFYPEDFRLNPQHNQGLDFAYSEVIRGQGARKCLNGCTRPGCCGNLLRKAVEIGGYIAPKTTRLSNALNEDEVEEGQSQDQDLLDEYLGDVKHRLKAMPESERKELLLQAQTEKFANQYGKHRSAAYGRASTPPGFWNTDMPTTQEEVENKKSANEMEKQKVEQMYREAMRPNGRYLLR